MIDMLVRRLLRRGWQRGVLEGNRAWTVIGGVAVVFYLGRKGLHREPEVVFSEKLLPGQSLRVTHEAEA